MHPAFSVIFLTTLIGAGQGLFLALYTGQLYALAKLLPEQTPYFYALGSMLSLVLLLAGLIASFFHLGHPERAWRAITRWRSSWLSREVIILPITMGLIAAYGLAHYVNWVEPFYVIVGILPVDPTLVIGLLATLAVFGLFICTAMIYAGIKFIQEWHSPLTVINYILLGGACGFTLAAAFSAYMETNLVTFYGVWAVVLTLMALVFRSLSLWRNTRLRYKSTPQTAIGVRHSRIVQKAQGAMGGSFNTREFFHHASPLFVQRIGWLFLLLVFPMPIMILAVAYTLQAEYLPAVAFGVQYLGLLAERWYFFADARHPQNLYYQSIA